MQVGGKSNAACMWRGHMSQQKCCSVNAKDHRCCLGALHRKGFIDQEGQRD